MWNSKTRKIWSVTCTWISLTAYTRGLVLYILMDTKKVSTKNIQRDFHPRTFFRSVNSLCVRLFRVHEKDMKKGIVHETACTWIVTYWEEPSQAFPMWLWSVGKSCTVPSHKQFGCVCRTASSNKKTIVREW